MGFLVSCLHLCLARVGGRIIYFYVILTHNLNMKKQILIQQPNIRPIIQNNVDHFGHFYHNSIVSSICQKYSKMTNCIFKRLLDGINRKI